MAESLRLMLEKLNHNLAEKIQKAEEENLEAELALNIAHQQDMTKLSETETNEKVSFTEDQRRNQEDFIKKQNDDISVLEAKHVEARKRLEEKQKQEMTAMQDMTKNRLVDFKSKEAENLTKFEVGQTDTKIHLEDKHQQEWNEMKEMCMKRLKEAEEILTNVLAPSRPAPKKATECPVCLDPMDPPMRIFQCGQGHYICETCKDNPEIKSCPSCRQPITGRNIGMEHAILEFAGCEEIEPSTSILELVEGEATNARGNHDQVDLKCAGDYTKLVQLHSTNCLSLKATVNSHVDGSIEELTPILKCLTKANHLVIIGKIELTASDCLLLEKLHSTTQLNIQASISFDLGRQGNSIQSLSPLLPLLTRTNQLVITGYSLDLKTPADVDLLFSAKQQISYSLQRLDLYCEVSNVQEEWVAELIAAVPVVDLQPGFKLTDNICDAVSRRMAQGGTQLQDLYLSCDLVNVRDIQFSCLVSSVSRVQLYTKVSQSQARIFARVNQL